MDDREILRTVAEAAGLKVRDQSNDKATSFWGDWGGPWNPLEDDGDALRLAVLLEMDVFVRAGRWTEAVAPMGEAYKAMHGGHPEQATRRAIVMAALLKPNSNPADWASRMRAKLDTLHGHKTPNVELSGGPGTPGPPARTQG